MMNIHVVQKMTTNDAGTLVSVEELEAWFNEKDAWKATVEYFQENKDSNVIFSMMFVPLRDKAAT